MQSGAGKKSVGAFGERLAARYFRKKGYEVLALNWRRPYGELDLVARAPDGATVFVEVKTREVDLPKLEREGDYDIFPEENITARKLRQLKKAIQGYIAEHKLVGEMRIDVVALDTDSELKKFRVRHYENIMLG